MKLIITESQYNILVNKPWHTVFGNINEGGKPKMTQDEFIERAKKIHSNPDGTPKYNYDKVDLDYSFYRWDEAKKLFSLMSTKKITTDVIED